MKKSSSWTDSPNDIQKESNLIPSDNLSTISSKSLPQKNALNEEVFFNETDPQYFEEEEDSAREEILAYNPEEEESNSLFNNDNNIFSNNINEEEDNSNTLFNNDNNIFLNNINEEEEEDNSNAHFNSDKNLNDFFMKNDFSNEEEERHFTKLVQNILNNQNDSNDYNSFKEEEENCTSNIVTNYNNFDESYCEEEQEPNNNIKVISNGKENLSSGKEEEEDFQNINNQSSFDEKEEEEEEATLNLEINHTNDFHQSFEEEEEEYSFQFENTESDVKSNYYDDHIELITENDEDTIQLFKKLENMDLDLSMIENAHQDEQIEEEEEEAEQEEITEEEEKQEDILSISNYDMSMDKDTKELFDVIDNLKIDSQPEKERPLKVFDPAIVNEEISTKEDFVNKQFDFQDSFVYRNVEADMKPFKQRGDKKGVYHDLASFDCAALVIDPSNPENEIDNFVTPEFNQYDEAAIITARTKDAPIPDDEILTQYPGEIESLILQAYLDFNDL